MIQREVLKKLDQKVQAGKVLVLYGARRTGKTTLIQTWQKSLKGTVRFLNGEDAEVQQLLSNRSKSNYELLLGNADCLIIDEAQVINETGLILKFVADTFLNLKIVATGSSVFDLSQKLGQPLTGRKRTIRLDPISIQELYNNVGFVELEGMKENLMVYGMFPEVINLKTKSEKEEYLLELTSDYLLQDILSFEGIRNARKVNDLLKLIAYQSGSEVSLNELGRSLSISKNTVEKYLDLLTKCFIIHPIGGFSRNLRKEVVKSQKWYFIDNGIRNAIISDFRPIHLRQDVGALWESFMISERLKWHNAQESSINQYFWRTYDKQEIDWIEEQHEQISAFEFKWNPVKTQKKPKAFATAYPDASYEVITPSNYASWLIKTQA